MMERVRAVATRVAKTLVLIVGVSVTQGALAAHSNEPVVEAFAFEHYFQGPVHARGFVKNRSGAIIRRFWAEIEGTWDESTQTLTLDEILHFDDGENLSRVWQIERTGDNRYVGRANDVDGEAMGETSGFDGLLRYALEVNYRGMDIVLSVDDHFHVVSEDVLFNRTQLSKFGFNVGMVSTVFYKGDTIANQLSLR